MRILRRCEPLMSDLKSGASGRVLIGARTDRCDPVFWERRLAAPWAFLVFVGVRD